jgi:hypothetical protein
VDVGDRARAEDAAVLLILPGISSLVSLASTMTPRKWALSFLDESTTSTSSKKSALIILNQPFSLGLLWRLWKASCWKACADGGANRLYDSFSGELEDLRARYFEHTLFCIGRLNGCSHVGSSPT